MLSIQCDENTAAAIIIDDVTEISMTDENWEISGRPTIGDTISFDVVGEGTFVDAFNGMRYLITDEHARDGFHLVSFVEVPNESQGVMDDTWFSYGEVPPSDDDDKQYSDEGIDTLRSFPGIIAPDDHGTTESSDQQVRQITIKNMPSMKLISVLMQDHGMSMHDIAAGLIALENETSTPVVNDDVIVDFFKQNADDIKDISDDFVTYSNRISQNESDESGNTRSLTV